MDAKLCNAIMTAAKRTIPFGNGGKTRAPFWSKTCEDAVRARAEALKKATAPGHTAADVQQYQAARSDADKTIQNEKTKFLRNKISELGVSTDLWSLLRALDGRRPAAKPAEPLNRPTTPGQAPPTRPAITDKEKANLLCQVYAGVSRIPKDKTEDHAIKLEARAAVSSCCCQGEKTGICCPFSPAELKAALSKIQNRKSPGPDGIPNDLLKQKATS